MHAASCNCAFQQRHLVPFVPAPLLGQLEEGQQSLIEARTTAERPVAVCEAKVLYLCSCPFAQSAGSLKREESRRQCIIPISIKDLRHIGQKHRVSISTM